MNMKSWFVLVLLSSIIVSCSINDKIEVNQKINKTLIGTWIGRTNSNMGHHYTWETIRRKDGTFLRRYYTKEFNYHPKHRDSINGEVLEWEKETALPYSPESGTWYTKENLLYEHFHQSSDIDSFRFYFLNSEQLQLQKFVKVKSLYKEEVIEIQRIETKKRSD